MSICLSFCASGNFRYMEWSIKDADFCYRTVPEGTEVKWKGTQLIKVDLKTRRVKSGSSSEDRFNMFTQLGIKNIDDVLTA